MTKQLKQEQHLRLLIAKAFKVPTSLLKKFEKMGSYTKDQVKI